MEGKNDKTSSVSRNYDIINHYVVAELIAALERLGFFRYIAARSVFTVQAAAHSLHLRSDYLFEICQFLVEKGVFSKNDNGDFTTNSGYADLRGFANFILAYGDMYRASAGLVDGSKIYGRDVTRNGYFLSHAAGSFSKVSVAPLVKRFQELGAKRIVDIGCGGAGLLLAAIQSIPDSFGWGIEIDESAAREAQKAVDASIHRHSLRIVNADGRNPMSFPADVFSADALVGVTLFHEFRKENKIVPILREYKSCFPTARLFVVEVDVPSWEKLQSEEDLLSRKVASIYKITHIFSDQGLPQSRDEWAETFTKAGWHVRGVRTLSNRLMLYECK